MAYTAALRAAQVPLLLRKFATLNHGFFSPIDVEIVDYH